MRTLYWHEVQQSNAKIVQSVGEYIIPAKPTTNLVRNAQINGLAYELRKADRTHAICTVEEMRERTACLVQRVC